jgi:predicted phosphohydrolase
VRSSNAEINGIVDWVVGSERDLKPQFETVSADSETPYADATRIRTHKNTERVKRPLNTFMVFAHYMRAKVSERGGKFNNATVSKRLGELWKTFT